MIFDEADCSRTVTTRPNIGTAVRTIQRNARRFTRVLVEQPSLILVRQGTLAIHLGNASWTIEEGEAVALAATATYDIAYHPSVTGLYDEQWLHWEPALIQAFAERAGPGDAARSARPLSRPGGPFLSSFSQAFEAMDCPAQLVPDAVAECRMTEVLLWLSHHGVRFAPGGHCDASTELRIRRLFLSAIDQGWNEREVAAHLGISASTLRRQLSGEGTSFREVLTDARMSFAERLLRTTGHSVGAIALQVGYDSASRFAIRFRKRFGFPPSAARGPIRGEKPI